MTHWRLNLTFRWIVNHHASSLGCRNEIQFPYRPVFLPTNRYPSHLLGVSYQSKAREIRTDRVFYPGSIVSIVDGVLTKTPSTFELSHQCVQLLDQWYLIPTRTIPEHFAIKFIRGQPVGSFIQMSSTPDRANVLFCHLLDEADRVWMRCRETNAFHFVRPVGVLATQFIERKVYIRSSNPLKCPLTLSSIDIQRFASSPLRNSVISQPESVTDAGSDMHLTSTSPRPRRSRSKKLVVPPGPWIHVLNGMCRLIRFNYLSFIWAMSCHTEMMGKMLSEESLHPVVVTVARGHTVTIYPELNPDTGIRTLGDSISLHSI